MSNIDWHGSFGMDPPVPRISKWQAIAETCCLTAGFLAVVVACSIVLGLAMVGSDGGGDLQPGHAIWGS